MEMPKLQDEGARKWGSVISEMFGMGEGRLPHAYYKALRFSAEWEDEHNDVIVALDASDSEINKERLIKANRHFAAMRQSGAQAIQEYLLAHDGVADFWPVHGLEFSYAYRHQKGERYTYDYFGDDYELTWQDEVRRKSDKLIYRNDFKFYGTREYQRLKSKEQELERACKGASYKSGGFLSVVYGAGLGYCLFALLTILADMAFGASSLLAGLLESVQAGDSIFHKVMQVVCSLLAFPSSLHWFMKSNLHGGLYWGALVMVLVVLASAIFLLFLHFKAARGDGGQAKKAQRAYRSFVKSADYKRIVAENEAERQRQEAFAEQWHRAWYDWTCKNCKSPAKRMVEKL